VRRNLAVRHSQGVVRRNLEVLRSQVEVRHSQVEVRRSLVEGGHSQVVGVHSLVEVGHSLVVAHSLVAVAHPSAAHSQCPLVVRSLAAALLHILAVGGRSLVVGHTQVVVPQSSQQEVVHILVAVHRRQVVVLLHTQVAVHHDLAVVLHILAVALLHTPVAVRPAHLSVALNLEAVRSQVVHSHGLEVVRGQEGAALRAVDPGVAEPHDHGEARDGNGLDAAPRLAVGHHPVHAAADGFRAQAGCRGKVPHHEGVAAHGLPLDVAVVHYSLSAGTLAGCGCGCANPCPSGVPGGDHTCQPVGSREGTRGEALPRLGGVHGADLEGALAVDAQLGCGGSHKTQRQHLDKAP